MFLRGRRRRSFTGKVAVITGGASGIGLALGEAFTRRGATVALLDLDGDRAESAARDLGHGAIGVTCDVTDEAACQRAIADVVEGLGGVDVIVANAGITLRESFLETESRALRQVMAVNFFGAVYSVQAALPSLVPRRGTIIVTSSIAGLAPLLGRSGYCASKHALQGLFATVRAELRDQGVHVLIACPSFVETGLQSHAIGGDGQVTHHPQSTTGRVNTPEVVAERICAAAERERPLLVFSPVGHLSRWLNALAPTLYERLMAHSLRTELER